MAMDLVKAWLFFWGVSCCAAKCDEGVSKKPKTSKTSGSLEMGNGIIRRAQEAELMSCFCQDRYETFYELEVGLAFEDLATCCCLGGSTGKS